jgi:preprotein translocase subunit SecE
MKKRNKKRTKSVGPFVKPSIPDSLDITWGKRYSLKDRTPVVFLVVFLACLFVLLSFLSVSKKDEDSIDDKGEGIHPIEKDIR